MDTITIHDFAPFLILAISVWGAFWAAVDGGRYLKTKNIVERTMCCLPFFAYGIEGAYNYFGNNVETYGAAFCLLPLLLIGMDPGTYFSSRQAKIMDSEPGFVDKIVRLFHGPDPRTITPYDGARPSIARVRLGMLLTGLIQIAGCIIYAVIIQDYFSAIMFTLAGVGRMIAYMPLNTEISEPANGFQRSFFAAVAIFYGAGK